MVKILAIDDNKDNLDVLQVLLSKSFPEAKLLLVQNGKEGIELCFTEIPDVILLDLSIPDMDGFEVCSMLKN